MPCDFVDVVRTATVGALRDSVSRQMPAGRLRDYYRWGLRPDRPEHQRFVRAIGVEQLSRLYASLTTGLVDDALRCKAAELFARLAVYQAYEIVSDHLDSGLFDPAPGRRAGADGEAGRTPPGDPSADARRRLLRTFNTAMTVRLRGGGRRAEVLLSAERRRAARVSSLERTPAGSAHRRLAGRFAGEGRMQWDLWPVLVANVEAAADVAATADGSALGPVVRAGLVERYRAVSRTLSAGYLSPVDLAAVGVHTALVAPTLAYGVAVVADLLDPLPGLAGTVDDGSLADALHGAALLCRLLNDAGPGLLRMGHRARRELLARARREAGGSLAAALTGPAFTRLARDVAFGEFNVCLYGARRAADPAAAFDALESDLDYFARLYATHRVRLAGTLERLTARLGDPRPATLVRRFVRFHTALYANPHDRAAGEYAV